MNRYIALFLAVSFATLMTGTVYFFHEKKNTLTSVSNIPSAVYDLWTHWKAKHNKKYGAVDEENIRLAVFYENYKKVLAHQTKPSKTYDMGFTKFMDLTTEEFKTKYLSTSIPSQSGNTTVLPIKNFEPIDWRNLGGVTPVKD